MKTQVQNKLINNRNKSVIKRKIKLDSKNV